MFSCFKCVNRMLNAVRLALLISLTIRPTTTCHPGHQDIRATSHQIPCWNSKLDKGEDGGCRCEDPQTPHNAQRLPPQVRCPETVHQPERGWTGPGDRPSHHTGLNPENPGVHLQDGTQRRAARKRYEATAERDR